MTGPESTMAVDLSEKESIDRSHPRAKPDTAMAADDATTHATGGSGKNTQNLKELCINWCIEGASDKHKAKQSLAEVLLTILKTFPDELFLLDNSNQELHYNLKDDDDTQTLTLQAIIEAKFIVHEANSPREQKTETMDVCTQDDVDR